MRRVKVQIQRSNYDAKHYNGFIMNDIFVKFGQEVQGLLPVIREKDQSSTGNTLFSVSGIVMREEMFKNIMLIINCVTRTEHEKIVELRKLFKYANK